MTTVDHDKGFLSRWSQRKAQARQGIAPADGPMPEVQSEATEAPTRDADAHALATPQAVAPRPTTDEAVPSAPPTLDDVASLTRESDYARFVARDVSGDVRNAALKKLFTDPHFNVMDGLDTYIDDYNTPNPLPASMLRQMAQAAYLGLVHPEPAAGNAPAEPHAAAPSAVETKPHDENPDLRLQPLDGAGPPGAAPGADEDAGRQR